MSSAKSVTVFGLLAGVESSYGAGATLSTATHGIQLAGLPELNPSFIFDGARPPNPGNYGQQPRNPPAGKACGMTVQMELKGAGTTYSGSVVPPNIHPFLLASGYDGTQGSTTWSYAPTPGPTGFDSLAISAYSRGELWPLTGVYGNLHIFAEGPGPAMVEFTLSGILGTRSDVVTVPTITYPALSVIPPNCTDMAISIGAVTNLVVRSFDYNDNASYDNARADLNIAGGHAGFVRGRRDPVLRVTVDNPLTGTLDVWSRLEAATDTPVTLQVGTVAFNRYILTLAQAKVSVGTALNDEDPASFIDLEIRPHTSTPVNNNDVVHLFS